MIQHIFKKFFAAKNFFFATFKGDFAFTVIKKYWLSFQIMRSNFPTHWPCYYHLVYKKEVRLNPRSQCPPVSILLRVPKTLSSVCGAFLRLTAAMMEVLTRPIPVAVSQMVVVFFTTIFLHRIVLKEFKMNER